MREAGLIYDIDHAPRTHVPDMEQAAYNPKPKDNGWTDLKLFRYDGTELYQWWGRRKLRAEPDGHVHYYVWEDPVDGPFQMKPAGAEDAVRAKVTAILGPLVKLAGTDFTEAERKAYAERKISEVIAAVRSGGQ